MSFEEAVKANQKQPRKIFVDLYTDWCGWCKKMDATTFQDSAVVRYMNEKYYAVKFNAEKKDTVRFEGNLFTVPAGGKTHQLAGALMQNRLSGYPSSSFLNEKNEIISTHSGFLTAENFLPQLKYFGENSYLSKTWDEFWISEYKKEVK